MSLTLEELGPLVSRVRDLPRSELARPWAWYLGVLLFALALPTLKIAFVVELRLGQILLIAGFGVLALRDLVAGRMMWNVLLVLVGCGLVLCAISAVAPYVKFKQAVFFVKYLFLFPAAFYVGARIIADTAPERMARILECVLLMACVLAVLLEFFPVALLIHERPEGLATGIKGSFWEQGEFAFFIGLMLLASFTLRLEHGLWPARPLWLYALYVFALGCGIASENRSMWIGLLAAFVAGGLLYRPGRGGGVAAQGWALRLVLVALVGAAGLWLYNLNLPASEKLISAEILSSKWDSERGAALRTAWEMIREQPLLGHGFGFIEAYFGTRAIGIVGLGAGVAQIFNSYIDLWVSVGLPGLLYGLALVWAVFDRRVLFATLVVTYLFVFANINPVAQSEYYHLFLGGAFALARWRARPGIKSFRLSPANVQGSTS